MTGVFGLRFDALACIEYFVSLPLAHCHISGSLGKIVVADCGNAR